MIQLPVVSHPPVILIALIPIPGFFGSPHNLKDMLFDKSSILGSFSHVSSIELKVSDGVDGGHPQVSQPQLGHEVQQGLVGQGITEEGASHGGVGLGVGVGVGVGTVIPEQT